MVTYITARPYVERDTFLQTMNRFIQIVALFVAAFLAAQPALANESCPLLLCSSGHSALNCCQHAGGMQMQGMSSDETMDSMSASCEMQQRDALTEPACGDGCCLALARPIPLFIATSVQTLSGDAILSRPLGASLLPAAYGSRPIGAASAPSSINQALFRALRI